MQHINIQGYKTSIQRNEDLKGESIEQMMNRILKLKEPIKDSAPIIYMDRKDGINPACDIRSDRHELALEIADAKTKSHLKRRDERFKERTESKDSKPAENKSAAETDGTKPQTPAA